jgi:hypothetical protein
VLSRRADRGGFYTGHSKKEFDNRKGERAMSKEVNRMITACCLDSGAATKVSFDAAEITAELKTNLEKRLLDKGVAVRWSDQATSPQLLIRVVEIDQGNRFLRYLLPFIAPAVLEVEGQMAAGGSNPQELHYVQRGQVGLFGGSARGMLRVCAQRVAKKIASDVLQGLTS